jgi:hypothetical protein
MVRGKEVKNLEKDWEVGTGNPAITGVLAETLHPPQSV